MLFIIIVAAVYTSILWGLTANKNLHNKGYSDNTWFWLGFIISIASLVVYIVLDVTAGVAEFPTLIRYALYVVCGGSLSGIIPVLITAAMPRSKSADIPDVQVSQ